MFAMLFDPRSGISVNRARAHLGCESDQRQQIRISKCHYLRQIQGSDYPSAAIFEPIDFLLLSNKKLIKGGFKWKWITSAFTQTVLPCRWSVFFNYQRKTQIAIQSVFKPRSFSDYRFSVADKWRFSQHCRLLWRCCAPFSPIRPHSRAFIANTGGGNENNRVLCLARRYVASLASLTSYEGSIVRKRIRPAFETVLKFQLTNKLIVSE